MTDGTTEGPAGAARAAGDGRPRVLLLGAGELNRELAIALRRLGAEVTTTSTADELPAAIGRSRPDFVVSAADTAFLDALDALPDGERPELVPSARAARLTADREGLRRLAADQLGLPTAPFWFAGSVGELEAVAAHAGYPLLVKPVTGASAPGRSVIRHPDDIAPAWQRAAGAQPRPRVLAETVVDIEFDITLYAVRSDGPRGPVIEFCSPIGHRRAEAGELESWQPQQLTDAALDASRSIAARIVKALGGRGVFGVNLMINGDEVYFADVSAGPRPSAWVTLRSQRLSVFDLQARAVLGLPVDTIMVSPGAARAIPPGRTAFPAAGALGGALAVPETDLLVFGPGSGPSDTTRPLGVALATAPDVAVARDRARQVATAVNMRDSRG
ncbi:formate-dependent phosphoribosylglycinamide formyltransferase [Mycobacterium sp. 663a-19]|uniref:formate-dependent phosphoribosylglycinamide formyltransferase n=1 Tax=Mycobacterium sp. 663a-19 TaxID=2986148 RepID=UPI002D1F7875|nr:formate-dependent phosphoribosylglycinamide formyltransferase [Mycobacterium sp. 663a-19]MEB3984048.1 formate-dependent phosphoribosylglycinamide formyltransferase [Mycobacterium sp. 663a-19]